MKAITKIDGIDLLKMIANDELECGTMIRYKREDLTIFKQMSNNITIDCVYEYYKYTAGDKRFHRCNEKGKLGATGQQRFMNYSTLNKTFEIVEIEENLEELINENLLKEDKDIEELDTKKTTNFGAEYVKENRYKINELIKEVNKLKNK